MQSFFTPTKQNKTLQFQQNLVEFGRYYRYCGYYRYFINIADIADIADIVDIVDIAEIIYIRVGIYKVLQSPYLPFP